MRFLGPDADAADELATYDQLATGTVPLAAYLTADDTISGTTEQDVNDTQLALTAGTWGFDFSLKWNSPDSVQNQFAVWYTGSFTSGSSGYDALRTATSTAHITGATINTLQATSGANPQLIIGQGILVATGSGTLGLSLKRNSSGTSTVPKGCYIKAFKMS